MCSPFSLCKTYSSCVCEHACIYVCVCKLNWTELECFCFDGGWIVIVWYLFFLFSRTMVCAQALNYVCPCIAIAIRSLLNSPHTIISHACSHHNHNVIIISGFVFFCFLFSRFRLCFPFSFSLLFWLLSTYSIKDRMLDANQKTKSVFVFIWPFFALLCFSIDVHCLSLLSLLLWISARRMHTNAIDLFDAANINLAIQI